MPTQTKEVIIMLIVLLGTFTNDFSLAKLQQNVASSNGQEVFWPDNIEMAEIIIAQRNIQTVVIDAGNQKLVEIAEKIKVLNVLLHLKEKLKVTFIGLTNDPILKTLMLRAGCKTVDKSLTKLESRPPELAKKIAQMYKPTN